MFVAFRGEWLKFRSKVKLFPIRNVAHMRLSVT